MASGKLSAADYEALAEFRHRIRQFFRFSEDAARRAGLNPQQHQLLLALKGLPKAVEPNVGEIAERLYIRHHSAVELIERLVRKGLIRKQRGNEDRRHVLLEVTARGERMLQKLSLPHREQLESMAPGLIKALNKVITENIEPHEKR
ncbi:MAG TPA: helix-turn-helix domain-containing protein [Terriglobia bacterium]|jgi:DNA-binding MarR family transcriptional regulator